MQKVTRAFRKLLEEIHLLLVPQRFGRVGAKGLQVYTPTLPNKGMQAPSYRVCSAPASRRRQHACRSGSLGIAVGFVICAESSHLDALTGLGLETSDVIVWPGVIRNHLDETGRVVRDNCREGAAAIAGKFGVPVVQSTYVSQLSRHDTSFVLGGAVDRRSVRLDPAAVLLRHRGIPALGFTGMLVLNMNLREPRT